MATTLEVIGEQINRFLMTYLSDVVILLVIFFTGIILAKIVGKSVKRILNELEFNAVIRRVSHKKIPASRIAETVVRYLLYLVTFIIVLDQLGITTTFFEIVFGGILLLLGLGVLLGFRDFFPNFFASFSVRNTLFVGQRLEYRKVQGTIVQLAPTNVIVEDKHKQRIYIPYSDLKREMYRVVSEEN